MTFRDRLLKSLEKVRSVLEIPGVMIGGSQVPNLLQPDAAATLVVSQDIDVVVPVALRSEVREARYAPSQAEPSMWLPIDQDQLEINFIGRDPDLRENSESYVLDDPKLPLIVFGLLGFLEEGPVINVGGTQVRLPRPAGLLVEKLLTERAGLKGERDLLVALGLLIQCRESEFAELVELYHALSHDAQTMLLGNLAVLSLMRPLPEMPDPVHGRETVHALIARLKEVTP